MSRKCNRVEMVEARTARAVKRAAPRRWIIGALDAFNLRGERREDRVGVWVRRPDKGDGVEDKIAAIGILVAVLNQLLIRSGREEQAMMTTLAGLIVVLTMLITQISTLFDTIKSVFGL